MTQEHNQLGLDLPELKRKALKVAVKDAEQGIIEAVFSTFNVIDHDGDVTVPGAFEDGAPVRISAWGHSSWFGNNPPIGKGIIHVENDRAILKGQFLMDTDHGLQAFRTIKGMGELQEWSYGFDVLESETGEFDEQEVRFLKKLKVHEVSPVLVGAGIETETLAAKLRADAADGNVTEVLAGETMVVRTIVAVQLEALQLDALKALAQFQRTAFRITIL